MTLNCAGLISKKEFHQFAPCCVLEMYATERCQVMMTGKYFHPECLAIWSFSKIRPKMHCKSYCMSDNKIHYNFPLQNILQHSRIFIFGLCTLLLEWSWKLASHFNFSFLSLFEGVMYLYHVCWSCTHITVCKTPQCPTSYLLPSFIFSYLFPFLFYPQTSVLPMCTWLLSLFIKAPGTQLLPSQLVQLAFGGGLLSSILELLTVLILCG